MNPHSTRELLDNPFGMKGMGHLFFAPRSIKNQSPLFYIFRTFRRTLEGCSQANQHAFTKGGRALGKRLTTQQLVQRQAPRSITEARRAETATTCVLGQPTRPQGQRTSVAGGMEQARRRTDSGRKLAKSDGAKLTALVDALRGSRIGSRRRRKPHGSNTKHCGKSSTRSSISRAKGSAEN